MSAGSSKKLQQLLARSVAVRVHFEQGLQRYDAGDVAGVRRHRSAIGMLPKGGAQCLEFLALRWRELWLDELGDQALAIVREAAMRFPDDHETALELGDVLNDLGRADEALEVLSAAAGKADDDSDLWYEVGLTAEALEQWELRKAAFRRVWEIEHRWEPPQRLWLSEERFIAVTTETLRRLPPMARAALGNVTILIEDYPDEWIFDTELADPRIMGLFCGAEWAQERGVDYVSDGPSRIYLYRWNIERLCGSEEDVERQVEITVQHEIGHYLGLDEEALQFRGLG